MQPPPNAKPCRYGLACNRPDCKFWHPHQSQPGAGAGTEGGGASNVVDVGDRLVKLGLSWVPQEMNLVLQGDGRVKVDSGELGAEGKAEEEGDRKKDEEETEEEKAGGEKTKKAEGKKELTRKKYKL